MSGERKGIEGWKEREKKEGNEGLRKVRGRWMKNWEKKGVDGKRLE